MQNDDQLYCDPALVGFYDIENGWADDTAFCLRLGSEVQSILDLGCGTGLLAAALAAGGHSVTGVDPACAMLDVARQREGGDAATFVAADARMLRLESRYDLVVLTGHAYQVFLSDEDQLAVLRTIAYHLAPGGRFIFDSRNPAAREWLEWQPENSLRMIEHPQHGTVKAWNTAAFDEPSGIVTYETHYQQASGGERWSATSRIRFTEKGRLEALLGEAGLVADQWLGDWKGAAFSPASPEIIPIGRLG
ncbi:class I SAM-dependent methyltransferase [Rhizobiaceae bacterium n13]|uniref:Class I SAM-dependent methyltransferase n=1 Tax=Ferirhizobium litorale TaxID=2927786 RepID=A0AAE3QDT1_9HYPH|nr:class I SAM-dependent methyltransferase [Fererhizobium litorale]MDI7861384.1 class I SAM-dependent methyltransferase [Fererhizobium litorale]MDI7921531.1 class I SAM-dependent methyltransferase [Fererhizobium litorale]